MIRTIMLVALVGFSCNVMHGLERWFGEKVDEITLAAGLREPTLGEQFQQGVQQVRQDVREFFNDSGASSSSSSSSRSRAASSFQGSGRVRQQRNPSATQSRMANKYSRENMPLPASYQAEQSSGQAAPYTQAEDEIQVKCDMLKMLSENKKEAVIVVGGVSAVVFLSFLFLKKKIKT